MTLVTLVYYLSMDVLDSSYVQTTGGLNCYKERLISVELTGNDSLLLVSSGH